MSEKSILFQQVFRQFCNLLQINDGNIEQTANAYKDQIKTPRDQRRFKERSACALHWLENYAPDDFKFKVNTQRPEFDLTDIQSTFLSNFKELLVKSEFQTDKDLHEPCTKLSIA